MKRVLILDNYDSFSYNLYQYVGEYAGGADVVKNDAYTCEEIADKFSPTHIIISPGPGRPEGAGITTKIPLFFAGKAAILGVCLGHQGICRAFGGSVVYAKKLMHGKADCITADTSCPIFKGLPQRFMAARYHSLAAGDIPAVLKVTARADDGEVMGVQHVDYSIYGVQFHPESILTEHGKQIISNFLQISEA
ncbi:MAG TPA: aminodeoxychorismate/anthranilate synthase component II [Candidatus Coproplasma avicola]|uniref:Aminodeoxychorismate/anthranilate synthase component II n=1 Tax=Candidatus Coproplasma avicola TaxID=2840744 RepID=A0A9D1E5X9_9FIRM|nr:aminodeoxychorismate/anthranilate synthase component II [Candidatus Coproplasma avicola]